MELESFFNKYRIADDKPKKNEYIKDGVFYCSVCNCRTRIPSPFGSGSVGIPCKCQEKEKEEREKRERARIIEQNQEECFGRSIAYYDYKFENADARDEESMVIAKDYVNNFDSYLKEGKGWVFYGNTGNGKTYLACCIANALISNNYKVRCTTVSEICNLQFETYEKQSFIDRFTKYSLLIIDDLGTERKTESMMQTIFDIIDNRLKARKPIIVTTNMGKEIFAKADGPYKRIVSRLYEMCNFKEFTKDDYRKQTLRDNKNGIKKKFGDGI